MSAVDLLVTPKQVVKQRCFDTVILKSAEALDESVSRSNKLRLNNLFRFKLAHIQTEILHL